MQRIRFNILIGFIVIVFVIFSIRVFYISIIKHDEYSNMLDTVIYGNIYGNSPPRGRIYDRNYKLLVDNVGIKNIYYKGGSNKLSVSKRLSEILSLDYTKVTKSMLIDLWLMENDGGKKISDEELNLFKERKLTSSDIESLKRGRISDSELKSVDSKQAYILYLMNNGYSYQEKLIKINASDEEYAIVSEENLDGVITKLSWERKYLYGDTLRGIFGNVSNEDIGITEELKDYYLKKGYSLTDRVGLSGLELYYDEYLRGEKAKYKKTVDGLKLIKDEKRGNDLVLSIDIDLQLEIEKIIKDEFVKTKKEPYTTYFNRVFSILSNPSSGEILSLVSLLYNNKNVYDYTSYLLSSSVTVGSVIKGASISVGYKNGVIDIGNVFKDECIKIMSTPVKCSWNRFGLGYLDDIKALKLSSNVYQFKTAIKVAGSNYYYNMPFSINNNAFKLYRDMFNSYGLGVKSGIDLPNESIGIRGYNDTPGLLLDFSIGQYDTYTPLQLASYINTIANDGNRLNLRLLKEVRNSNNELIVENKSYILNKVDLDSKYINRIKDGFKAVLEYGGTGYGYIDKKFNPAGKTGTSQSFYDSDKDGVIDKATITSTFAGFAPFDNPKMSLVVVTPDVSLQNGTDYLTQVNRRISYQISKKYFEIYK